MINKILKYFIYLFILFLIFNILYLNWYLFFTPKPKKETITPLVTENNIAEPNTSCPTDCLTKIQEATSSIIIPTPQTIVKKEEIIKTNPSAKELYVPLGSGNTKSFEWVDAPGAESYVDAGNLGKIKSAYFEASLRIPTANGELSARLYNVTQKHQVWNSEVSTVNSAGTLVISKPITLDNGNNLYRIQLKTSMGYDSYLDQGRIKILLE